MDSDTVRATDWLRPLLLLEAVLLILITSAELTIRIETSAPISVPFVAGVSTSLPLTFVLLAGAYRLPQMEVPRERYRRLTAWIISGMAFFVAFFTIIAVFFFDRLLDQVGVLRWALSVGAGFGFLAGFYNTRSIEQAVQAERATIRADEAQTRQELLEYLNAVLRHEVLNTANIISGRMTLLEDHLDDSESAETHVAIIQNQIDDLTSVIGDVRILLSAAEREDTLEPANIVPIIRNQLDRLAKRHEEAHIEYELPPDAVVEADDLVSWLFSNLFENAIEHNDSDKPIVTVTGAIDDTSVEIRITDNGPGVSAELREDLFDPTVSIHDDQSRLGTVIVGRLINRYNGDISVVTTGSDGTTISVLLPLSDRDQHESRDTS